MDDNPLAFAPIEVMLAVSLLAGLAIGAALLVGASRSRFAWVPAAITALVAVVVPVVGPVVALWVYSNLRRDRVRPAD